MTAAPPVTTDARSNPLDGLLTTPPEPSNPTQPLPLLVRHGLAQWEARIKELTYQRDAWVQGVLVGLGLDPQTMRIHVDAEKGTYQVSGPLLGLRLSRT